MRLINVLIAVVLLVVVVLVALWLIHRVDGPDRNEHAAAVVAVR